MIEDAGQSNADGDQSNADGDQSNADGDQSNGDVVDVKAKEAARAAGAAENA